MDTQGISAPCPSPTLKEIACDFSAALRGVEQVIAGLKLGSKAKPLQRTRLGSGDEGARLASVITSNPAIHDHDRPSSLCLDVE
jgi:hypothetical protein